MIVFVAHYLKFLEWVQRSDTFISEYFVVTEEVEELVFLFFIFLFSLER